MLGIFLYSKMTEYSFILKSQQSKILHPKKIAVPNLLKKEDNSRYYRHIFTFLKPWLPIQREKRESRLFIYLKSPKRDNTWFFVLFFKGRRVLPHLCPLAKLFLRVP
jgi:hypothetical protein